MEYSFISENPKHKTSFSGHSNVCDNRFCGIIKTFLGNQNELRSSMSAENLVNKIEFKNHKLTSYFL